MVSVAGEVVVGVTGGRGAHLPAEAEHLRLPLHERSQRRMLDRWGFTVDAPDAVERARLLDAEAPDDPDRLVLLAVVLSSRGDDGAASELAGRALVLAPHSARVHSTAAAVASRRGDVDTAFVHAARAVELDADDPAALYNRGALLWEGGDRRAALDDFGAARRLLGLPPEPSRWRPWRKRR